MKEINCKNCDWSWEVEKNDSNPNLCHKCGFDDLKNEFDFKALENWKKSIEDKPYKQLQLENGTIQRVFSINTDDSELTWHRDKEDRLVYLSEDTDWMFQFENSLPVYMNLDEAIYIPKNTYHRIIKGTDDLKVEIVFVDDNELIKEGKKKKGDRCTRIAKRKYDTWPSAYASGAVVKCRKGKIWKNLKEEEIQEELEEASKTDFSKEKESGLHGWFSRQGGKGKSKGWVDCNTCRKDKKTGRKTCKSCGRKEGEKRAKYPSCRPTPSACGTKGKGESWGKKSKNENVNFINESKFETKSEFYKANNIDPDNLSWIGKGDFGDAYSIGDGRVLKKTTSKKEFSIAEELVGRNIPHLATIYAIGEVKMWNNPSTYYIIMEELEEDSSIEDMFYDLMNIVEEQGGSFEYLGDLDLSELDLSDEMVEFIDVIETIYRMCHNNGIYRPDVRPENLGRDKNGVIKMFDIDSHDRRMEEAVRKTIRKIFKESAEKNFKIDYPYYKIEKLVDYYKEEFDDYMNKQGWAIFQSDSPSLSDKYNSDKNGYFWQVQVIDEPYGEAGFYDEEGNALIGITTDQEAIELARKTGLMVDELGAVYGFKETSLLNEDLNHSDESIFNSITKNEIGGLDFSGDDYLKASVDISDYFIDAYGEKKPYRHMEVYRIDSKIDFSSKNIFDRVERKGIGTKMLSELISYCKQNNIPYIGSKSLNEKSFGLFKKFEDKGVLSPTEYGLHKKTILWKIN